MKTKNFLKKHEACCNSARWALSISEDMADVWDALIKEERYEWLLWTATRPGAFPDSVLQKLACRFIRETPLADGRKVWNLLVDERSRRAVEVAEQYADGKATETELDAAYAAFVAACDADAAAYDAAYTAADAAYAAARAADAAYAAARAAHAAYAAADAARAAHATYDSAYAAAYATYDSAYAAADAAYAAARAYAYAAADAAYAHAKAAQIKMIAELGNPFRKGQEDE